MEKRTFRIKEKDMDDFREYLQERESSLATIEKYMRDMRKIAGFIGGEEVGKEQIAMIMETMCATGIRVSELKYFRVENVKKGIVRVWNKGKYRIVIIPAVLRKKLLLYISKNKIRSGIIFCTRTGKEKDRSNIWREMKQIAKKAGVKLERVFPHNLRHLFARTFYRETKNLLNLADILGHSSLEVTRIYASDGMSEWKRNLEKLKLLESTT